MFKIQELIRVQEEIYRAAKRNYPNSLFLKVGSDLDSI